MDWPTTFTVVKLFLLYIYHNTFVYLHLVCYHLLVRKDCRIKPRVFLRVSIQLTPLQFYYSLQTEAQLAAAAAAAAASAAAAAAAAVVKETQEERSPLSGCRRGDAVAASTGTSSCRRRGPQASVGSKVKSSETAKLRTCKQGSRKTERKAVATPQSRDAGESTAITDSRADSDLPAKRDDQRRKCDGGKTGDDADKQTGSAAAAAAAGGDDDDEKDCCGRGDDSTNSSASPVQSGQDGAKEATSSERADDGGKPSTSNSLPPTLPAVVVSKLKIFKCSESQKLCVRSADALAAPPPPPERPPTDAAAAVPKLSVAKSFAARRSGGSRAVGVCARRRDDDKRERRRRRRRTKADAERKSTTVLDRGMTVADADGAMSPVPSVPDAAECPTDAPTCPRAPSPTSQINPPSSSPRSSSDNVVSSSTSSRLLPDDDDDDDDEVGATSKPRGPRRSADAAADDPAGKSADQAAAAGTSEGSGDAAATTLRVPIRLGGQSGMPAGELLLRLPQNVSVQCSFRADQILIASSPATTQAAAGTEQSTSASVADDTTELPASRPHVSDAY